MARIRYIQNDEGTTIRWVEGNSTSEVLNGTNRYVDTIDGKGGNDTIDGLAGADTLMGDEGRDLLYGGNGGDYLGGDDGNDQMFGGDGDDYFRGNRGEDVVNGGAGDDSALLDREDDRAGMQDGDDYVKAGRGNDRVWGDAGNDLLFGNEDDDRINGGAGDDFLDGGAGNDQLYGGADADFMQGGEGDDLLGTDDGDTIAFSLFQGSVFGEDTVTGLPGQVSFRADGTLDADGRAGEIDMVSFLDSNGSGEITGADLWVRTEDDDLVLDVGAIYDLAFAETLEGPQTVTFEGIDRLDTGVVLSILQPGVEYGRPVGVWNGEGIDVREPDF